MAELDNLSAMQKTQTTLTRLLPVTADVNALGHLIIGGCDVSSLAREFATPLYIFDEQTIRSQCRTFLRAFRALHADTTVAYAAKAYLGRALAGIVAEEGLDLDVVSGGELAIARSVNFPAHRIHFHGNNKSEGELREALEYGIGRVIVDNFHEIALLDAIAREKGVKQKVLLRLSPGIDPHTHRLTTTGTTDSKFGFAMVSGQAEEAVRVVLAMSGLELVGLHVHLGSPVFELEPYLEAVDVIYAFAARMRDITGWIMQEFSPGGGFAVDYTECQQAPTPSDYAAVIVNALFAACSRYHFALPRLFIEPGRSLVAQSAVAVYTVGSSKEIPGVRRYVSVDGGMADNIRPALYDACYSALLAENPLETLRETVTVVGKYCESGDVLMSNAELPPLKAGDLLVMPCAGAYALAMSSNYNAALRPAVVMVQSGRSRLIRRREVYDDLMRLDI